MTNSYADLRRAAEDFDDIQRTRIRLENRDRAYGDTVDPAHALLAEMAGEDDVRLALRLMRQTERDVQKVLVHTYRDVVTPEIRAWQKRTKGIGEHMLARLLGAIGDPYIATPIDWEGIPTDAPFARTVSQLWAYCGHGAALKRRKGMDRDDARALGNDRAKVITHLLAEAVIKARNEDYRAVYDYEKAKALAWPPVEVKGKLVATTKGHAHAHALRIVGKHILRDLWVAARADRVMVEAA